MATVQEAIDRLIVEYRETGRERVEAGLKSATKGEGDLATAQRARAKATDQAVTATQRMQREYERTVQQQMRMLQIERDLYNATMQHSAANDNLTRSTIAASEGWRSQAVEIASMTNHLKFAALALYAWSPAVRAAVNPAITATIAAMGPAAVAAARGIGQALAPMLGFLARISLPILAVVAAWEALTAIISKGAGLLEKYGNVSRQLDDAKLKENIASLTRLQNDDTPLTIRREAGELAERLDQAHFRLKEFMRTQIDLNGVSLSLQRLWVSIVELIAKAADALPNSVEKARKALGTGQFSPSNTPERIGARREVFSEAFPAMSPAVQDAQQDLDQLRRIAKAQIEQINQMKKAGTGPEGADVVMTNFNAKFNVQTKLLAEGEKAAEKAAKETKDLASQFDALVASMERSAAAQEAEALAVDAGVREHARLRTEMRLQEAALQEIARTGKGTIDDYAERIKIVADRFGNAAQEAAELRLQSNIDFKADTFGLSDIDKQIASILRQTYGSEWKSMMDSPIAQTMRWQATLEKVNGTLGNLVSTLATDLAKGVNGFDSLAAAAGRLGNQLIDMASKQLVQQALGPLMSGGGPTNVVGAAGNQAVPTFGAAASGAGGLFGSIGTLAGLGSAAGPIGAGVALAIGVGLQMFSQSQEAKKAEEEAKRRWREMETEVRNFNTAADGFELSQFVSAMQQITKTGIDLVKAAVAAGDIAGAIHVIQSGVKQINNQVDQFIKPKGNSVGEQIAATNNEAQQIIAELDDLNAKYGLGLNRTAEILSAAADHIAEIQRKAQEAIDARRLSFQDRAFAAANDNTTLEGQLAALHRDQQRDLLAEEKAGNEARADALVAFQAEELALRKSFNDKAIEETKRAEQERLDAINGAAKNIVDYLTGLTSGPSSTLSPTAVLENARAAYNANYALALGGNLEAQNKFTQLAENFRTASRSVNASGQPYQNDLNQIISQGLALPAVQATTDPTTQAMRDVLLELQTGRLASIASGVGTTATNTGTAATNTGSTATSTNSIASDTSFQNQILNFQSLQNGVLEGLNQGINNSATRIVNAINSHGLMSKSAFENLSLHLAHIRNGMDFTAAHAQGGARGDYGPTTVGVTSGWNFIPGATGGRIVGGIPGIDSVPLLTMQDEYLVQRSATRALERDYGAHIMDTINAGRLPESTTNVIPFRTSEVLPPVHSGGGSGEVVAELRMLRQTAEKQGDELKQLHTKIANATMNGANQAVRYVGEKLEEVVGQGSKRIENQLRMNSQKQRVASR
jgi:hypothetical protein